jgi:hypothetical protein
MQAFINKHSKLLVVLKEKRVVEIPYFILACFIVGALDVNTGDVLVAVNKDSCAIILLFTVGANNFSCCFNAITYKKNGKQYNSVNIYN